MRAVASTSLHSIASSRWPIRCRRQATFAVSCTHDRSRRWLPAGVIWSTAPIVKGSSPQTRLGVCGSCSHALPATTPSPRFGCSRATSPGPDASSARPSTPWSRPGCYAGPATPELPSPARLDQLCSWRVAWHPWRLDRCAPWRGWSERGRPAGCRSRRYRHTTRWQRPTSLGCARSPANCVEPSVRGHRQVSSVDDRRLSSSRCEQSG